MVSRAGRAQYVAAKKRRNAMRYTGASAKGAAKAAGCALGKAACTPPHVRAMTDHVMVLTMSCAICAAVMSGRAQRGVHRRQHSVDEHGERDDAAQP